jgi:CheY-like chemotaxis protein
MEGRIFGGRYRLQQEIGRGGMGSIWEARDQQFERRVAIKIITPEHRAAADLARALEHEARAIARLNHPHVVQVFDYGLEDGSPYIVMELLTGEDLESRLDRHERMPLPTAIKIVDQIAQALTAAHGAGIVHRDLKPGNVFLVRGVEEEWLKVLDFGVVSLLADAGDGTWSAGVAGTPGYMSPEQLRSARPDARCDVWALGVIAYRLLTGEMPFAGATLADLIVGICTDPFPPATERAPELPAAADAFFERALAKDPAQRFQTARELASAFAALATAGERGSVKVLVVDDEPDVASLLKQRFRHQIRQSIYQFLFAGDGEQGLAELRQHPDVDVILSDINMPGMDGLTFLGKIGELNPTARTVIVSAYSDTSNIRVAMNRGAFDFLVKPIDFQDLEVTIEKTYKHVAELRRKQRSDAENQTLRSLVSPSFLERLDAEGARAALAGRLAEGTVAVIDLRLAPGPELAPTVALEVEAFLRRINANLDVVVPEMRAHGGRVEQFFGELTVVSFTGDGHAERALTASMALRGQLAAIATRAGEAAPYVHNPTIAIDSGALIEGAVGSPTFGRIEYRISGQPVRTALELVRQAATGELLVTAAVQEAVPLRFGFEALGARSLPTSPQPIEVFRATGRLRVSATANVDEQGKTTFIARTSRVKPV